jgi:putative salt-induced outer membrane protein YdiY
MTSMQIMSPRSAVLAAIALVSSALSARAQDSTKAPPKTPFATIHADLGYVSTSGNTSVSTLNLADALTLRPSQRNEIDQAFSLVYGTSNNHVQTSIWTAALEDQYKFRPWLGLYALGDFDRNTFAGIKARFDEGAGVALIPVDTKHDHLEFDVGVSYVELQAINAAGGDSTDDYTALHTEATYKHTLVKDTYFQEILEGIPDLKTSADYRVNSETDVVAPLSKHLAIKVGYTIHYANLPPPGFKTTDRLLTSDLQITF